MRVIQASWSPSSGLYLWGVASEQTDLESRHNNPNPQRTDRAFDDEDNTLVALSLSDQTNLDYISQISTPSPRSSISLEELDTLPVYARSNTRDNFAAPLPQALSHSILEKDIALLEIDEAECCFVSVSIPTDQHGRTLFTPRLLNNASCDSEYDHRYEQSHPWVVPALLLDPLAAMSFLTGSRDQIPEGLVFDQSVDFWVECSKLVLELLTRGMYLPSIVKLGNEHIASWELVLSESEDINRLNLLCRAIPNVCLCLMDDGRPQAVEPYRLVTSFLETCADHLIRSFLERSSLFQANKNHTLNSKRQVCMNWLDKLTSSNPRLSSTSYAPLLEVIELEQQITRWKSRVSTGRDRPDIVPCFHLNAPRTEKTDIAPIEVQEHSKPWHLHFGIQSVAAPEVMLGAEQLWLNDLGFLARSDYSNDDLEELLLGALAKSATFCAPIRRALEQSHPTGALLTSSEAYEFLNKTKPLLEKYGFHVTLPNWLNERNTGIGLHLHLTSSADDDQSQTGMGLSQLISFSWHVAIGDKLLSLEDFEKLIETNTPLVAVGDKWYEISSEKAQSTVAFLKEQQARNKMPLLEALRIAFGAEQKSSFNLESLPVKGVTASGWIENLLSGGGMIATQTPQPSSFKGELRPYQKEGLSWLVFLAESGIGGCLADDMGLGKTIQLLAYLAHEQETKTREQILPCLLCAPMSVVDNWEKETHSFTPNLKVYVHHGPQRLSGQEFIGRIADYDLVVTTYSLAYRDELQIAQVPWGTIVLDEAQNIKNLSSKQSQAIRRIAYSQNSLPNRTSACQRFALTGTPLENRLEELWSIFDFLNPGFLGSMDSFKGQFVIPIEKYRDASYAARLSSLVKPFLLRRLKTDPKVISDLPEKIEMDVSTPLSVEQASLYQRVLSAMLDQIESSDGIHRKGLVLATITRLKQICNHPSLFLHDSNPSPERSGKLQCLEELLEVIVAEGDKVLVFTQFAQMGKLLKYRLQEFLGEEVLFLHGELPKRARSELIDRFQNQAKPQVFILSLKAGGYGLNLTAASQVIHFDQWWNPAVHDQATDRAHRIGQRNPVQVRRFICKGTLEERIAQMLKTKRDLASLIVPETKSMITQMSTDELRNLLELTAF